MKPPSRKPGKAVSQFVDQWWLACWCDLAPHAYYKYGLFLTERGTSAVDYIQRQEMSAIVASLNPSKDLGLLIDKVLFGAGRQLRGRRHRLPGEPGRWPAGVRLVTHHPDTGQAITGVTLPHWRQARQLCLTAHEQLSDFVLLGWDVALTEEITPRARNCFRKGLTVPVGGGPLNDLWLAHLKADRNSPPTGSRQETHTADRETAFAS